MHSSALGLALAALAGASGDPRPSGAPTDWAHVSFRFALGAEWDTNARRSIESGTIGGLGDPLDTESNDGVVSDGLTRLLVDGQSTFELARDHQLQLGYVLGAKRFFGQGSEDLLVHDLGASTSHAVARWLALSTWGNFRASRIRSGLRDYTFGAAGAALAFHVGDPVTARAIVSFSDFDFPSERRLSYRGPSLGGDISVRPLPRITIAGRAERVWRSYEGNALVQAVVATPEGGSTTVLTFCDGAGDNLTPPACSPLDRDDREIQVSVRGAYRGRVMIGGEYSLRLQRSTSDLEDIDRHRVSLFSTFPLPFELTGNLLAALQINNGVSVTETKFLAEDDENQNSVQVQVSRDLTEALSAEARYALFANQFTTADVSFLRQTFYFGLSYRIGR